MGWEILASTWIEPQTAELLSLRQIYEKRTLQACFKKVPSIRR
jgi:hypothetical protein